MQQQLSQKFLSRRSNAYGVALRMEQTSLQGATTEAFLEGGFGAKIAFRQVARTSAIDDRSKLMCGKGETRGGLLGFSRQNSSIMHARF